MHVLPWYTYVLDNSPSIRNDITSNFEIGPSVSRHYALCIQWKLHLISSHYTVSRQLKSSIFGGFVVVVCLLLFCFCLFGFSFCRFFPRICRKESAAPYLSTLFAWLLIYPIYVICVCTNIFQHIVDTLNCYYKVLFSNLLWIRSILFLHFFIWMYFMLLSLTEVRSIF